MNRLNRSLLAVAVAGGLCGGIRLAHGGFPNLIQSVQRLDDEKNPHMKHALAHPKAELEAAGGAFKAHSAEVIASVDAAIKEAETGLKEQGDSTDVPADAPPRERDSDAKFPHLHHALDRLVEARVDLAAAETIFAGHRDKAMDATDNAIRLVENDIHDFAK
jgi:hypothetical protein